jgi:transcriptional regulator with XRE-family HTH domain
LIFTILLFFTVDFYNQYYIKRNLQINHCGEAIMSKKSTDAHPIDIRVGATIRLLRNRLGINQEQLAAKIGITFQQVQKYEQGRNRVSCSKLYEIAQILEVSPGYFFPDGVTTERDETILFVRENAPLMEKIIHLPPPLLSVMVAQAEAFFALTLSVNSDP